MIIPNVDELVRVQTSWTCPACGGEKGSGKNICVRCWREVPLAVRRKMYRRQLPDVLLGVNACLTWLRDRGPGAEVERPWDPPYARSV